MRKCVFFDRDGIVNESPGAGYVEKWENFRLMPEFVDILRIVSELGFDAVIVTNQRGVARGIMSAAAVEEIHSNLRDLLSRRHKLELLDIFCCPHGANECDCRKPKPGMLLKAAAKHDIDLAKSWMVGDHETDIQAGRSAGCRTIRVCSSDEETGADFRAEDMAGLSASIKNIISKK